jgi:hypothetical protein
MAQTLHHENQSVPSDFPPGYGYSEDLMMDYDEQVAAAHEAHAYQQQPTPSYDNVPRADVTPTFNPTNAPEDQVYARGRAPEDMRPHTRPHSEFDPDRELIDIWRIEERARVISGLGLVASRLTVDNNLGDVEGFDSVKHLSSNHEGRGTDADRTTPFVSFASDPEYMAENLILTRGFGVKGDRDPVVVHTKVHPSRVLTKGLNRESEVLLLGGVAPDEFHGAYEVGDFVAGTLPEDTKVQIGGQMMTRDEALRHWQPPQAPTAS